MFDRCYWINLNTLLLIFLKRKGGERDGPGLEREEGKHVWNLLGIFFAKACF